MEELMQYVNTGELLTAGPYTLLNSGAIGSCVVITVHDATTQFGLMAHVMLPGASPAKNKKYKTRYAANAIEEILHQLKKHSIDKSRIELCVIGGANVLRRKDDTIAKDNVASVIHLLQNEQLKINAKSIGGFYRRTAIFDIKKGCIYYTIGNSEQRILWQTENKKC